MKTIWQAVLAIGIAVVVCLAYAPQAKQQLDAKAQAQAEAAARYDAIAAEHYAGITKNMEKLHKKEEANASKNRPDNGRRVDGDTMR